MSISTLEKIAIPVYPDKILKAIKCKKVHKSHKSTEETIRWLYITNNNSRFWFNNFSCLVQYALHYIFEKWSICDSDFLNKYFNRTSYKELRETTKRTGTGTIPDGDRDTRRYLLSVPPRVADLNSAEHIMATKYKKLYKSYIRKIQKAKKNMLEKQRKKYMHPDITVRRT